MSDSSNVSAVEQHQQYTPLQQNEIESGVTSKNITRESTMHSAEVMLSNDENTSAGSFIKTVSRDGRTLTTSGDQIDDVNNPISIPTSTNLTQL